MRPLLLAWLAVAAPADLPSPGEGAERAAVHDLARVGADAPLVGSPGRFAFTPDSRPDEVLGFWAVEAAGPDDCLRVVYFAPGRATRGWKGPRRSSSRARPW